MPIPSKNILNTIHWPNLSTASEPPAPPPVAALLHVWSTSNVQLCRVSGWGAILWSSGHAYTSMPRRKTCRLAAFSSRFAMSSWLRRALAGTWNMGCRIAEPIRQTVGGVSHRAPWMGMLAVEACSPPIFWFVLKKRCQRLMFLFLLFCEGWQHFLFLFSKLGGFGGIFFW